MADGEPAAATGRVPGPPSDPAKPRMRQRVLLLSLIRTCAIRPITFSSEGGDAHAVE